MKTVKKIGVMQDRGNGLKIYQCWQALDENGNPLGYPQATRKLALSWK